MFIVDTAIEKSIELENDIHIFKIFSPDIASIINPGEFLNVKVSDTLYPLLRRPFSICDVEGDYIFLMFNIFGEGTRILAHKHPGDIINILGPLGKGFNFGSNFETAVIVAGGLGAAPFPFLTRKIGNKKNILTLIGGKTHREVITYGMKNIHIATDDGSLGTKGTVIDLLNENKKLFTSSRAKIFGCGPTPMLKALKKFSLENNLDSEVSTECAMACGFGICQGCPIESTSVQDKYLLVCKDGPVFNVRDVVI